VASQIPSTMSSDVVTCLCELLDVVYELRDRHRFRRQAILVLLQQFLHTMIERRIEESVSFLLSEDQLTWCITRILDTIWPVYDPVRHSYYQSELPRSLRTMEQRQSTYEEAEEKLCQLMIDILGGLLGRDSVRQGTSRFISSLQNRYLNKHLLFCLFDEWLTMIFPEVCFDGSS
jgi:hypothetical protein